MRTDIDAVRRERFERVAGAIYEPLARFAGRRTNRDLVDDIVADTLLVLWRRLDEVPPGSELWWCYGVARRNLANQRRSTQRRLRLVRRLTAQPAAPAADAQRTALDPELAGALKRLSRDDREILLLWAWEDLEPREIAPVLGITANAAGVRLHRARRRLELLLGVGNDGTASGHSDRTNPEDR